MANKDTGLGWYANENWLASQPTQIATLTKPSASTRFRGTSIDTGLGWYADSDYLVYTSGTTLVSISATGYGAYPWRTFRKYVDGYAIAVYVSDGWTHKGPLVISTNSEYAKLTVDTGFSPPFPVSASGTVTYLNRTWYYFNSYWYDNDEFDSVANLHILSYNAEQPSDMEHMVLNVLAAAGVSDSPPEETHNYNKSTNGYAVVCNCKWITSYGGDVYFSPVLISSQQNNTLYTRDGATPSVNTTEHQYQGMTFYMRKAPLDTFTAGAEIASTFPIVDLSGVAQTNDTIFSAIAYQSGLTVGQVDPYSGAGESEPGAEEATFDFDSTEIDFGTPPTVTAAGMVELYIPSTSDLASLAQYLWAGSFDPDNFKKLFADPMDAIIGLQIVPVTATEIGTTPDTLYVGNISTGLSMPKASRQYVPVDCGSLSIPRRLGSYLDYSPHTEMQLYLPYIGFVDISPDDCMGGTVSVKYLVDIIGGTCVAQVKCNDHVLYEYAAACSCQVPVSAGQYQNIVLGAVRGGIGLVSGILGAAGGGLFSGLSEAADAAMSMTKPKIQRSGGFGGSSGLMGHQTPYIIYTVPRLIVPGRQNNFIGYPSYITRTLGDLTGYTQIDSIHLTGIPASQSEQAEIEQLLQEGVYL